MSEATDLEIGDVVVGIGKEMAGRLPGWYFYYSELYFLYSRERYDEMEELYGVRITRPSIIGGPGVYLPPETDQLFFTIAIHTFEKDNWLEGHLARKVPELVDRELWLEAEWRAQLIMDINPLPEDTIRP